MTRNSNVDPVSVVSGAVVVGVWSALPDFVQGASTRRVLRAGLVGVGATVVAVRQASLERRNAQALEAGGSKTREQGSSDPGGAVAHGAGPVTVAGLAAAGVGLSLAGLILGQRIDDAVAGAFARRGVRHPYTATGVLWAVVSPVVWLLPDE